MEKPKGTMVALLQMERDRKNRREEGAASSTHPPALPPLPVTASVEDEPGIGIPASQELGSQPPKFGIPASQELGSQPPKTWDPKKETWAHRTGERYMPSRRLRGKLSARLPLDLIDELDAFCTHYKVDKQEVLEAALTDYLGSQKRVGIPTIGRPASQKPPINYYDDKGIISFYEGLKGSKATARDRAALEDVADLPDDVIREGVRLAFQRKPVGIYSLAYCIPAIREIAGRPIARVPEAGEAQGLTSEERELIAHADFHRQAIEKVPGHADNLRRTFGDVLPWEPGYIPLSKRAPP